MQIESSNQESHLLKSNLRLLRLMYPAGAKNELVYNSCIAISNQIENYTHHEQHKYARRMFRAYCGYDYKYTIKKEECEPHQSIQHV